MRTTTAKSWSVKIISCANSRTAGRIAYKLSSVAWKKSNYALSFVP